MPRRSTTILRTGDPAPGTEYRERMPSSRIAALIGAVACAVLAIAACGRAGPSGDALRGAIAAAGVEPLETIEQRPEMVALGEALFFDPILSGNRDVSCATCHEPALATTDHLSLSIGSGGTGRGADRVLADAFLHVPRNSPSLFNRGNELWHSFFWDGRVSVGSGGVITPAGEAMPDDVSLQAAQALITVASPIEMRGFPGDVDVRGESNELALFAPDEWAQIWEATMARLLAIDGYRPLLADAFPGRGPDDLHLADVMEALAAYQAEVFTSDGSPFDRFLGGEDGALRGPAREGAALFFGSGGCSACHSGPLLSDQEFHSIAAPQVGPGRGNVAPLDAGRGAVDGTGALGFRTPPLRNVALTGPYLHDGSYAELDDVIRHHLDPAAALAAFDSSHLREDVEVDHLADVREEILASVSPTLGGRALTDAEIEALVAFLESLTDPGTADLEALVPSEVPSGLPIYPEG